MLGVIVNTLTVLVGSGIGLLAKKVILKAWADHILCGLALCVVYIGISGAFEGKNVLIAIISMALGSVIGIALDLDKRLNRLAEGIENRFKKGGKRVSIAEGFVTASLLFCVGALTIVGSIQAGLTGNNEMLYTKSTLDFVSSMVFAASLGFGVMLAAIFVLVFQGGLVLMAGAVAPFLDEAVIAEMTCVGSLLIIGLGLNMLGITKLKIMNYIPAVFMPILLCPLAQWIGNIVSELL